ncbi:hypothetical protein AVEN_230587-1, partial [Araneus ventricosus]
MTRITLQTVALPRTPFKVSDRTCDPRHQIYRTRGSHARWILVRNQVLNLELYGPEGNTLPPERRDSLK